MSTQTAEPPQKTNGATETVQKWPLSRVHISEYNTRHPKPTEPGIKELAESLKHGQTTPAIGRLHPKKGKDHIELAAGARRRVAAEVAKLDTLDVIVRQYPNEDAFETQILVENLQREDPDPRQEIKLLDRIVKRGITTTSAISAELGKPEHWVARRLKLLDVIPEIRKQWESGRDNRFCDYTVEMMELIGSLPKDTQLTLFKDNQGYWLRHCQSRADLQKKLEQNVFCRLASAPFDLNDKRFFVKGCGPGCASDSSKQGALFDMSNGDARCLNCSCFQSRLGKWRKVKLEELKKKHGIKKDLPLLLNRPGMYDRQSIRVGDQSYNAVTPEYNQKIVFEEPKKGAGQQVYVTNTTGTEFKIGWLVKGRESSGGGSSHSSRPKLSSKESRELRKKMLQGKRWSLVHDQLRDALIKCPHTQVTQPIEDLVAVFGLPSEYHASSHDTYMPGSTKDTKGVYHWKVLDERKKKGYPLYQDHELGEVYDDKLKYEKQRNTALWSGLKVVLAGVIKGFYKVSDAGDSEHDMRRVAKLIKFDIDKAKKEADLQIPPPKTWGKVDTHTLEPLK